MIIYPLCSAEENIIEVWFDTTVCKWWILFGLKYFVMTVLNKMAMSGVWAWTNEWREIKLRGVFMELRRYMHAYE